MKVEIKTKVGDHRKCPVDQGFLRAMTQNAIGICGLAMAMVLLPKMALAGCTIYEHSNYRGASKYIEGGHSLSSLGGAWNDKVSAVKVGRGCSLEVWQHRDFNGSREVFSKSSPHVGVWNDEISSARCSCRQAAHAPCVMYEHADFGGKRYVVSANTKHTLGHEWNDEVSSVKVPRGCRLLVYQHRNFRGDQRPFSAGSYPNIGNLWNDQISSARCLCN